MANRIADHMKTTHTKFIEAAIPTKLEKLENGKIKVHYETAGEEKTDEYDTVLFAIGRYALTKGLNLQNAEVVAEKNGKIKVNVFEQTNIPHIYAIGDVQLGRLELTPTAIMAGQLLAQRLYGKSKLIMDYTNVPTTVFTPLEYGCCGLSEEQALEQHGEDAIDVYHTAFKPLEWAFNKMTERSGYVKVIVHKKTQKVLGFHILCPNAGEVTQGMGIAMKCGLTKDKLDATVGIHPTVAEECVDLHITKRDDPNATKTGC